MADLFLPEEVHELLANKAVFIIGSSVQRTVYKDLVALLQTTEYLSCANLKNKGESSFRSDELLAGGTKGKMTNGIGYREVRQYLSEYFFVRFYFVTRCYNSYVKSILSEIFSGDGPDPDIIIMNSCLWDISRYGPRSVDEYKINMEKLFKHVAEIMPANTLFIWNTTLPISKMARGGVLIPDVEALTNRFRLDLLEANYLAHTLVLRFHLDILDLHYYMRHHLHRRIEDGIHWDMTAHRRITNLLLTHIAEAWCHPLPGRVDPSMLNKMTHSGSCNSGSHSQGNSATSVRNSGISFFPQNTKNSQTFKANKPNIPNMVNMPTLGACVQRDMAFDDMNRNVPSMRDAFGGLIDRTSRYGANLPSGYYEQQQHLNDQYSDIDPMLMQNVMSMCQSMRPNFRRGGGGGQFFNRFGPY